MIDVPAESTVSTAAPMTSTKFSQREVPWLKLGRLVSEPKSAEEAAELGGLNFDVVKAPLTWRYEDSDGIVHSGAIAERVATVRRDTNHWLGIVSAEYPVLNYGEAFSFLNTVSPTFVAAGALQGGRQGFMVARLPESITMLPDVDPHELFAVLRTSHNGSRAVEVAVMPLRHRCMNQLTLRSFTAGVEHRWAIRHTSTMVDKLAEAQDTLGRLTQYAESFTSTALSLIDTSITEDQARYALEYVIPNRPRKPQQIERIIESWHTAPEVGFDFTGWGLVNAVSEFMDWQRTGGTHESRFVGALSGQTTQLINRTAHIIMNFV